MGATGDIGLVKIVSEGSIGSNLRRIEAVTGTGSVALLQRDEHELDDIAALVGSPGDARGGVQRKLDEARALADEVKVLRSRLAAGRAGELAAAAVDGGVVARVDGLAPDELRELALAVRGRGVTAVVLIGVTPTGGVSLVGAVQPGLGTPASALLTDAAKAVGGGGGGKGDVATAGGKDASNVEQALTLARDAVALATGS